MKFIYNEEEAKKRKEKYDRQIEEDTRINRKWEAVAGIFTILFALSFVLATTLACFFMDSVDSLCITICFAASAVSLMVALIIYTLVNMSPPLNQFDLYNATAWYYTRTNGFNVLQTMIEKGKYALTISAALEDKNGNVKNEHLCTLRRQVSTVVSEEIADVMQGVWYVPYETKEKEIDCENRKENEYEG